MLSDASNNKFHEKLPLIILAIVNSNFIQCRVSGIEIAIIEFLEFVVFILDMAKRVLYFAENGGRLCGRLRPEKP
jgi:hypothetical protein